METGMHATEEKPGQNWHVCVGCGRDAIRIFCEKNDEGISLLKKMRISHKTLKEDNDSRLTVCCRKLAIQSFKGCCRTIRIYCR